MVAGIATDLHTSFQAHGIELSFQLKKFILGEL